MPTKPERTAKLTKQYKRLQPTTACICAKQMCILALASELISPIHVPVRIYSNFGSFSIPLGCYLRCKRRRFYQRSMLTTRCWNILALSQRTAEIRHQSVKAFSVMREVVIQQRTSPKLYAVITIVGCCFRFHVPEIKARQPPWAPPSKISKACCRLQQCRRRHNLRLFTVYSHIQTSTYHTV